MKAARLAGVTGTLALLLVLPLAAQTLYKYRGADGEWIYTDRKPATLEQVEIRELDGSRSGNVSLERFSANGRQTLLANNSLHAPVQLRLLPPGATSATAPGYRDWVLPPQSSTELMSFEIGTPAAIASANQRYMWLLGDPESDHLPETPYRAPFPAAVSHRISQAWPQLVTHTTEDSAHAVDIAMPIGSNVLAARDGVVVEVASKNFRSTVTPGDETARANIVRILHADGTFAIYAHLNWNSIRVRPGDRVRAGDYIANSGNTGFSTGPHLHFVVLRNAGMRLTSMPVTFAARDGSPIEPETGSMLTAY